MWLIYGLLENRENDHDLRFICETDKPQIVADEQAAEGFEAFMAFPKTTACQLEPGSRFEIAPVAALLGMPCRFANAAERAN
jgi:hypothetical protein